MGTGIGPRECISSHGDTNQVVETWIRSCQPLSGHQKADHATGTQMGPHTPTDAPSSSEHGGTMLVRPRAMTAAPATRCGSVMCRTHDALRLHHLLGDRIHGVRLGHVLLEEPQQALALHARREPSNAAGCSPCEGRRASGPMSMLRIIATIHLLYIPDRRLPGLSNSRRAPTADNNVHTPQSALLPSAAAPAPSCPQSAHLPLRATPTSEL